MGCVPTSIEKIEDGAPGKLKVVGKYKDGTEYVDEYNTVIFAIGRDACTNKIGLDKVGVKLNPKNGKVVHNEAEQTNVPNIYAIGDVLDDKPELTPMAIQSGMGLETTVMVRSILLRGFDQQMANKIGEYMEEHGVNMVRECVPTSIEKIEDGAPG